MRSSITLTNLLFISLLLGCFDHSSAFMTTLPRQAIGVSTHTSIQATFDSNNNDDYSRAMESNKQRTCIKQFLTQRSIQSFMFLAEQVRDPHTADWIERLLGKTDLLNYHGTGAFNITRFPTWDAFFMELIEQPKSKIIIQAKRRGRGHGGWSKNNPYLKDRYVEFEVLIDPESILPRIMSVREQLANEFVQDVDSVRHANDQSE